MKEKDTLNTNGITPLHIASVEGNIEEVQDLLSQGADINSTDNEGNTSLHVATMGGNIELAKFLIKQGADINAKNEYGSTPLHIAECLLNKAIEKIKENLAEAEIVKILEIAKILKDAKFKM